MPRSDRCSGSVKARQSNTRDRLTLFLKTAFCIQPQISMVRLIVTCRASVAMLTDAADWHSTSGCVPTSASSIDPQLLEMNGQEIQRYSNEASSQSGFPYAHEARSPGEVAINASRSFGQHRHPQRRSQAHPMPTSQLPGASRQAWSGPWTHVPITTQIPPQTSRRKRPRLQPHRSSDSHPTSEHSYGYDSTRLSNATLSATTETSWNPELGDSVATLVPNETHQGAQYTPRQTYPASADSNQLHEEYLEDMSCFQGSLSTRIEEDASRYIQSQLTTCARRLTLDRQSFPPPNIPDECQTYGLTASPDPTAAPTNEYDVLVCQEPDCEARFSGQYGRGNLHRHVRLKHGAQERLYPCGREDCQKCFKRQDARLKHWRRRHTGPRTAPL
jgi:hypothetical protein